MKYPTVSVIISTYNRAKMLRQALSSVLTQKHDIPGGFEVIVVDDASTDNTIGTMESMDKMFEMKRIPVYYYKLGENSGYQCRPKNIGVQHSNGEFIAYLDDDNLWKQNHLQALWSAIQERDCDMVYGMREYHATDNCENPPCLGIGPIYPYDLKRIAEGNFIDTSDIMHSKGAFYYLVNKQGYGWDENLNRFGDWNLVYRWGQAGLTATPVYKVLTEYWWHGENLQMTRKPIEAPIAMERSSFKGTK